MIRKLLVLVFASAAAPASAQIASRETTPAASRPADVHPEVGGVPRANETHSAGGQAIRDNRKSPLAGLNGIGASDARDARSERTPSLLRGADAKHLGSMPMSRSSQMSGLLEIDNGFDVTSHKTFGKVGPDFWYNAMQVSEALAGTTAISGVSLLGIRHDVGAGFKGARNTVYVETNIKGAPAADSDNLNFVPIYTRGVATTSLGGTSSKPRGTIFGANPVGQLNAGATGYFEVAGLEANVGVASPREAPYFRVGISSVGFGAGQGKLNDAAIDIGAMGTGSLGWKTAISINATHGAAPMDPAGTILAGTGRTAIGVDLSAFTFSNAAFASPGFAVLPDGQILSSIAARAPVLIAAAGANKGGAGGILEFRTAASPAFSPMADVHGSLERAVGSELQGGIAIATRAIGAPGQPLVDRMLVCHNGAVAIGNSTCDYTLRVSGTTHVDSLNQTQKTPASSKAPCTVGDHAVDANYTYECYAPNAWSRTALDKSAF